MSRRPPASSLPSVFPTAPVSANVSEQRLELLELEVAKLTRKVKQLEAVQNFDPEEAKLFLNFQKVFGEQTESFMENRDIELARQDGKLNVHSALKLIVLRLNKVAQDATAALSGAAHDHLVITASATDPQLALGQPSDQTP